MDCSRSIDHSLTLKLSVKKRLLRLQLSNRLPPCQTKGASLWALVMSQHVLALRCQFFSLLLSMVRLFLCCVVHSVLASVAFKWEFVSDLSRGIFVGDSLPPTFHSCWFSDSTNAWLPSQTLSKSPRTGWLTGFFRGSPWIRSARKFHLLVVQKKAFKAIPFLKAMAFLAWKLCGLMSRFASVMRTLGAVFNSRVNLGLVS